MKEEEELGQLLSTTKTEGGRSLAIELWFEIRGPLMDGKLG